jgi:hypothetical protein
MSLLHISNKKRDKRPISRGHSSALHGNTRAEYKVKGPACFDLLCLVGLGVNSLLRRWRRPTRQQPGASLGLRVTLRGFFRGPFQAYGRQPRPCLPPAHPWLSSSASLSPLAQRRVRSTQISVLLALWGRFAGPLPLESFAWCSSGPLVGDRPLAREIDTEPT